MSFVLIIIGFMFLFNPNFSIIDIVPDFIGFFMIFFGLTKMSRLSENADSSRKHAFALTVVELLKLFSMGLLNGTDKTWYLLLPFSFGVVECILFVLFAKELFLGIERLGVRYDAEYVLSSSGKGKRRGDVITRTHTTVVSFFIARTVFATIPEFTVLNTDDLNRDYTGLRAFLYLLGTLIVLVWAVFFVLRVISFFNGIRRDQKFVSAIESSYTDFEAGNTDYRRSFKMKAVMLLFVLATIAVLNFNEDGLSMILTAVPALIISAASCMIIRDNKLAVAPAIIGLPLVALSVFNLTLRQKFYHSDVVKFRDIFYYEDSMKLFSPVSNLMLVEYILLTAQFILFVYVLHKVINNDLSNKSFYISSSNEANSTLKKELMDHLGWLMKICTVITAVTLTFNLVNVKLSVLFGSLSVGIPYGEFDTFQVVYNGCVIVLALLTVAMFVTAIRLYRFAKEYIYTDDHTYGGAHE